MKRTNTNSPSGGGRQKLAKGQGDTSKPKALTHVMESQRLEGATAHTLSQNPNITDQGTTQSEGKKTSPRVQRKSSLSEDSELLCESAL